jgi:hypothetical protein
MMKNASRVFAGYAAGFYTLPDRLIQLHDALHRLADVPLPVEPVEPDEVWAELLEEAATEFVAGKPLLDPAKRMTAARAGVVAWQEQGQMRAELERRLNAALDGGVSSARDEIIRDHLQPALVRVRDAIETATKVLPAHVSTADLLSAGDKARAAWLQLDQAAALYDGLRTAWHALETEPEFDVKGEFIELVNLTDIWPTFGKSNLKAESVAPWPTKTTTARLLWLGHHGARLILPTQAERDELWWSKYGADVELTRQRQQLAQGYRQLHGAA